MNGLSGLEVKLESIHSKKSIRRIWSDLFRGESQKAQSIGLLRKTIEDLSTMCLKDTAWACDLPGKQVLKMLQGDSSPLLRFMQNEPVIVPVMVSGMVMASHTIASLNKLGIGHGGLVLLGFQQYEIERYGLDRKTLYAIKENEGYLIGYASSGKPALVVDERINTGLTSIAVHDYLSGLGFGKMFMLSRRHNGNCDQFTFEKLKGRGAIARLFSHKKSRVVYDT